MKGRVSNSIFKVIVIVYAGVACVAALTRLNLIILWRYLLVKILICRHCFLLVDVILVIAANQNLVVFEQCLGIERLTSWLACFSF